MIIEEQVLERAAAVSAFQPDGHEASGGGGTRPPQSGNASL